MSFWHMSNVASQRSESIEFARV